MAYKDNILEFSNHSIIDKTSNLEVMMDWEDPLMLKTAQYICQNGGDILEIGFGMGICSDYIQSYDIKSHTIIEIHPQIIEKLKDWAEGKNNVNIIEGDWYTVKNLETYDAVFIDTYLDKNIPNFKDFALSICKDGGRISYWNYLADENFFNFDNIEFSKIPIDPPENSYSSFVDNYYLPKVIK